MPIDTAEYRRSSRFSRWFREVLRAAILPRCDPTRRDAYAAQFDEASRNVEICAEGLLRLMRRHPVKGAMVLGTVRQWSASYHGTQRATQEARRYVVYTERDRAIPFRPAEDTLYAYMVGQIAYIAFELAEVLSRREMQRVAGTFRALNSLGAEAFAAYTTVMPRYTDHDRITLRVVQHVDAPVNCCPSLHIAYSVLLDGLAERVIDLPRRRPEVFQAIRFATLGMFNSVLYTKQHALIDVAFGILAAQVVFERTFAPRRLPVDLDAIFGPLADEHPIPYDVISGIHAEAAALYAEVGDFTEAMGAYLRRHGFPTVAAGDDADTCWFDTEARELVR